MPKRRALLVGINEYKGFDNLSGCENDVRAIKDVLVSRYEFKHIRTLLSAEATGKAIRSELQRLIDDTGEDDVVVFYFAGHGSQMRDRDNDEPSGFDNTLTPHDSQHDAAHPELNTDIVDDELRGVFGRLSEKTPYVTIIVDACHSGSITRGGDAPMLGATRGLPPYLGMPPVRDELPRAMRTRGAATYTALMACRDAELAREVIVGEDKRGAFTYYLVQHLTKASPTATAREVFERAARDVQDILSGSQRPQIEGVLDRQMFGVEARPAMTYLRVAGLDATARTMRVAGGAALGLIVDTRVAVYAQETTSTENATPLRRGRVTKVGAVESVVALDGDFFVPSDAAPASDAPSDVPVIDLLARVVVEEVPEARRARRVYVAPLSADAVASPKHDELLQEMQGLKDDLQKANSLVLVESLDPEALLVRLQAPATADANWRWAVCAPDGNPIAPLKSFAERQVVVQNCQVLARQWLTKSIANANKASRLGQGKVRVEFLISPPPYTGFDVAPIGEEGVPVLMQYETAYGLRVHNDHDKPVYVTLIDFTMDGSIVQHYPPPGATTSTPIPVKSSFEIFTTGEPQGYGLPENYPWAPDGALPARDDGMATMRLFVTEQEVKFDFLLLGLTTRAGAKSLEQFLAEEIGVKPLPATRGQRSLAPADADWTTIDIRFLVRRTKPEVISPDIVRSATNAGVVVRQTLTPVSRDGAPPAVKLDAVPDGFARVLMMVGEDGVPQFVFPEAPTTRSTGTPGAYEFELPLQPSTEATRGAGLLFAIPAVKELLFPIVDSVFASVGTSLAVSVEEQVRPYAFRRVPAAPTEAVWPEVTSDEWRELASGKILLLLHGPLSTGQDTFSDMPADVLARLHAAYGGRVIAFDHPTLGHDPRRNAEEFVARLPDGLALSADIVAVSRGGLVARMLASEFDILQPRARRLSVERVVLLGTPNEGTPLADLKNLKLFTKMVPYANAGRKILKASEMGQSMVKAVNSVVSGATGALLWPLVGQAALAMVTGLPGLQSMSPTSDFLSARKAIAAPEPKYFAVASSVDAADGAVLRVARQLLGLELGKQHDMMVSLPSVLSPSIPFTATKTIDGMHGFTHFAYMESSLVHEALMEWLGA